jgi:hypothetical protein
MRLLTLRSMSCNTILIWYVGTNDSKDCTATIFRLEMVAVYHSKGFITHAIAIQMFVAMKSSNLRYLRAVPKYEDGCEGDYFSQVLGSPSW